MKGPGKQRTRKTVKKTTGVVPIRPLKNPETDTSEPEGDPQEKESETKGDTKGENSRPEDRLVERLRRSAPVRLLLSRQFHLGVTGLLFMGILALGAWKGYQYLYNSPNFGLKHIEISPTYHADRETLISMAQLSWGQNLFRIRPGDVRKRILMHPWVKAVSVWKSLPSTLHIEVTEHESVLAILFSGDSSCDNEPCDIESTPFYLINPEGEIFKRAAPEELRQKVIVTGLSRELFRNKPRMVHRAVRRSLEILKLYQENPARPELSEIYLANDVVVLYLKHSPCAIHLEPSDLPARLVYLDQLLATMDLPLEKVQTIYLDDRENPLRIIVMPVMEPVDESQEESSPE